MQTEHALTRWMYDLFSFHGRIGIKRWWYGNIKIWVSTFILLALYWKVIPFHPHVLTSLLTVLLVWMRLALNVKRLHDRNMSGWWAIIEVIPMLSGGSAYLGGLHWGAAGMIWFIGSAILFVLSGFFKGTEGENRFGEIHET